VRYDPIVTIPRLLAVVLLAAGALFCRWRAHTDPVVHALEPVSLIAPDVRVSKTRQSIRVGGEIRDYVLTRPATPEPGTTYALVVGFHGYRGEVKAWFHEYTAFDRHVADGKFIIAYPEGPVAWEAGNDGRDLAFFNALIAELRKNFPVDPARIHVVGHSNGASFTTFLLAARADVIASGAVQAGADLPPAKSPPGRRPPLLLMWGELDGGAQAVEVVAKEYRAAGFTVEPVVFSGLGHGWGGPAYREEERALDFFQAHPLTAGGTAPAR
jgi:poly(3-hydroxybutyrate) depolymerase